MNIYQSMNHCFRKKIDSINANAYTSDCLYLRLISLLFKSSECLNILLDIGIPWFHCGTRNVIFINNPINMQ